MKNLLFLSAFCLFMVNNSLMAQIKVASNGNVGINNASPTYKLDVNGSLRAGTSGYELIWDGSTLTSTSAYAVLGGSYPWYAIVATNAYFYYDPVILSDKEAKTDIADLAPMSQKLFQLRPVSYKLKSPTKDTLIIDKQKDATQFGFIAQEIKEIFPEVVVEREDGMLGVQYSELIPVLVQVMKDQQGEIDELKKQISELKGKSK
jgi:hypothetical protein